MRGTPHDCLGARLRSRRAPQDYCEGSRPDWRGCRRYGLPLVIMDITRRVMTNVALPQTNGRAPINQFSNALKCLTAADRDVVRPNLDTLASSAWLDLSKEPIVVSVPNTNDRYYLMPLMDGWTDVFASIGKRTTGTGSGNTQSLARTGMATCLTISASSDLLPTSFGSSAKRRSTVLPIAPPSTSSSNNTSSLR